MIDRMWEILTTLTEESKKAALATCVELSLDTNRGEISLDESYINLNAAVIILKDAIEQRKLIQLPITIQTVLVAILESIAKHQTNLIAGSDEVINLSSAIEKLNTTIWQYGLHNLSNEVLGYQAKLNQLKTLEIDATRINDELKDGLKLKKKLDQLHIEAEKQLGLISQSSIAANQVSTEIAQALISTTDSSHKVSALLATVQQNETSSTQRLASSVQNDAEISALEKKIKEFFTQINDYRTKIDETSDSAATTVSNNTTQTNTLITNLADLEDQIKKQIQKATGFSLFHSFQTRQESISKSKNFWVKVLAGLLVATAGLTYYLVNTITGIDTAFFLKLSLSIPLIFAISFCTVQYSRERRLEEEYAFKSNISISLVPYQELVEKLVSKDQPEERQRYATFIMDSITKVFTSPTEEIFKEKSQGKGLGDVKTVKQITELIEAVSKGLKNG
jgi:hypothetical protein